MFEVATWQSNRLVHFNPLEVRILVLPSTNKKVTKACKPIIRQGHTVRRRLCYQFILWLGVYIAWYQALLRDKGK
jgi:hypothetical protein